MKAVALAIMALGSLTACAAPLAVDRQPAVLLFRGGASATCAHGVQLVESLARVLCYQEDGVVHFRSEDVAAIKYLYRVRPDAPTS
jgi:hypothetical protein